MPWNGDRRHVTKTQMDTGVEESVSREKTGMEPWWGDGRMTEDGEACVGSRSDRMLEADNNQILTGNYKENNHLKFSTCR